LATLSKWSGEAPTGEDFVQTLQRATDHELATAVPERKVEHGACCEAVEEGNGFQCVPHNANE
tara:strand:- start:146 stop:334 length:189 start_codon:yes stop_codon:yes gene_type:complete